MLRIFMIISMSLGIAHHTYTSDQAQPPAVKQSFLKHVPGKSKKLCSASAHLITAATLVAACHTIPYDRALTKKIGIVPLGLVAASCGYNAWSHLCHACGYPKKQPSRLPWLTIPATLIASGFLGYSISELVRYLMVALRSEPSLPAKTEGIARFIAFTSALVYAMHKHLKNEWDVLVKNSKSDNQ